MTQPAEEILKEEFQFYLDNQEDFVKKYDGRVIVLKSHSVIGTYDTEGQAVSETQKDHELGTFLVQRVSEGSEAYTQTFHSRARFP